MPKTLMILEASSKQDYIFSSKMLRENAARSACISYVTSDAFFKSCCDSYSRKGNMVYSGGGHAVLQFDDKSTAMAFANAVTLKARQDFDDLELFVKQLDYEESLSPRDNLSRLSRALEAKKALRQCAIRQLSFGIEKPAIPKALAGMPALKGQLPAPPEGYKFPAMFEDLAGDDPFIAVIHIDGNSMGRRVSWIYERPEAKQWDGCRQLMDAFSRDIQHDYESAFHELCETLRDITDTDQLPIRPVVLAGDDVCFVTAGHLGLACADRMLKTLSTITNKEDRQPYAACAGVAIVHKNYPFFQAYRLSESLCRNAKKFSAEADAQKNVSAIDWHIEFGQIKGGLEKLRDDYKTPDGDLLTLRPFACVAPPNVNIENVKTFTFFRNLTCKLQGKNNLLPKSKIKELRSALKQGECESEFYLRDREISHLLYNALTDSSYPVSGHENSVPVFTLLKGDRYKRCLFFDSIELLDHCAFF